MNIEPPSNPSSEASVIVTESAAPLVQIHAGDGIGISLADTATLAAVVAVLSGTATTAHASSLGDRAVDWLGAGVVAEAINKAVDHGPDAIVWLSELMKHGGAGGR